MFIFSQQKSHEIIAVLHVSANESAAVPYKYEPKVAQLIGFVQVIDPSRVNL